MNYVFSISLLFVFACGGSTPAPAASTDAPGSCPAVTAPCMNEGNHAECVAREAECPGAVLHLESCPLQFACE